MKKILIILTGVLLVWNEPVIAKNEITIASTIKVAKNALKNKKTVQKKKYKSVKNNNKKAYKSVKKKVVKKAKKVYYGKSYIYNKGEMQQYAHNLVYQYGWGEDDYYAIVMIVNHESSWRPNAVNKKSGSCGLFQAYPCSKMAKYGKDYRTNYKTQMKFGFEYIKARYQTPTKAWAFWQNHHWY